MKTTTLYEICESRKEGELFIYTIRLNPDHDIFKGHFPGMPVLPGVCMLQAVKDCIAGTTGKTSHFSYIKSCKFISVVNPEEHPVLTVSFSIAADTLRATITTNDTPTLKLSATLMEE